MSWTMNSRKTGCLLRPDFLTFKMRQYTQITPRYHSAPTSMYLCQNLAQSCLSDEQVHSLCLPSRQAGQVPTTHCLPPCCRLCIPELARVSSSCGDPFWLILPKQFAVDGFCSSPLNCVFPGRMMLIASVLLGGLHSKVFHCTVFSKAWKVRKSTYRLQARRYFVNWQNKEFFMVKSLSSGEN